VGARERKEVRGAMWEELLVRKSSSLVLMGVAIVVLVSFVWLSRCDDLLVLCLKSRRRLMTYVDNVREIDGCRCIDVGF